MVSDSWTSRRSAYAPGALAERPVMCTCSPIWIIGSDTTGVPADQASRVSAPYSSTRPLNSWPMTTDSCGRMMSSYPMPETRSAIWSACLRACRSEPQMPPRTTSSSTWPGPGTGSGTSATSSFVS